MKEQINNTRYIIIGVLGTAFFMCFLLILFFIVKSHVEGSELQKFGSAGDFFNGFISPLIGAISAILVYIAFKQQVDQNATQTESLHSEQLDNKADKDFDRYLKLIDEVEKYQNRIQILITNSMSTVTTKYEGKEAIEAYIRYISLEDRFRRFQTIENRIEFEKTLYTYLVYLNFIFSNANKLKEKYYSYYSFLITKLFMNVPNTIMHINGLIEKQDIIIIHANIEAHALNMEVHKAKAHVDFITFN